MVALDPDEIERRAAEAFTYLYPLVTMDVSRLVLTAPGGGGLLDVTVNQLAHARSFPPTDFRDVVAVNYDTLYSSAWLDLSAGPLVLHVPDSGGRYYLLPLYDMWTDAFAVPGKRTTGTGEQRLLLAPPGWSGDAPAGTTRIDAPTSTIWMIGRTQTNGPADYAAVNAFQNGMRLETLDGGVPASPSVSVAPAGLDVTGDPLTLVNALPAAEFFAYAARLLARFSPHPTDFDVLARIAPLGLRPGEAFDAAALGEAGGAALQRGAEAALRRIDRSIPTMARVVDGWAMNTDTMGVYGNHYLKRAAVAVVGLGANNPADAVYPLSVADDAGARIVGEHDYVQHFAAAELPPVDAFWSVTMYDADSFPAPNALDRAALGDRDPLHYGDDGSLDLFYGPTDPGGADTANWLPAPSGPLRIIMRLYAPHPEVLDGTWNPPAIVRR